MVLAILSRLVDDKDFIKQQAAKVGEMMTLPVFDTQAESFHGLLVFRASFSFVSPRCAPLRGGETLNEFVVVRVVFLRAVLYEWLFEMMSQ